MPQTSPDVSSTKSKPVRKGSAQSARNAAQTAFAASSNLSLSTEKSVVAPEQQGRRRLVGSFMIDLNRIEPDPDQPRKQLDPDYIEGLAASIAREGILQPISVRYVEDSKMYRIISGHCRHAAAKKAGLTEMPCWLKNPSEEKILLHQIVENWQRSDLNPFELADSLAVLKDSNGYSQQQLAELTGKSKGEISKTLAILELTPDVQAAARSDDSGVITKSHLYAIARMEPEKQAGTVARIAKEKLTVGELERMLERQLDAAEKKTETRPQFYRRSFRTSEASVTFTFKSNTLDDEDVLRAMLEIKRQLAGHEEIGKPQ